MDTGEIFSYLSNYIKSNDVVKIIIGEPKSLDGGLTDSSRLIYNFHRKLSQKSTAESKWNYTTKGLHQKSLSKCLFQLDSKKIKEKNKETVDKISAVIILQDYLKAESFYQSFKNINHLILFLHLNNVLLQIFPEQTCLKLIVLVFSNKRNF